MFKLFFSVVWGLLTDLGRMLLGLFIWDRLLSSLDDGANAGADA